MLNVRLIKKKMFYTLISLSAGLMGFSEGTKAFWKGCIIIKKRINRSIRNKRLSNSIEEKESISK